MTMTLNDGIGKWNDDVTVVRSISERMEEYDAKPMAVVHYYCLGVTEEMRIPSVLWWPTDDEGRRYHWT